MLPLGRRNTPPLFTLLAALLGFGMLLARPARAGDGGIADGRLDLLVFFTYPEDDAAAWEPVFTEYSKLLLNATEGGLQLGTVRFTTCEVWKSAADVWVLDDNSGARAHLNGLGVPGRHMTISQLHESTGGAALGQFGLAHETGHYVWGVYDEYRGYIGNTPGAHVAHYCVSSFGDVSCLMDGGTTVFPNHLRTEFCTDYAAGFPTTRHFIGTSDAQGNAIRTDQEYLLGRSCWRQIEISGRGGLTHPPTDPSGDLPAHEDVVFDYSRYNGLLGMALVLDTSGSMSAEEKLAQAILGADVGVGLLRDGEYLTIVGFADTPTVVYPARGMTEARKRAAIAALESLTADGGTVIGTGVLEAVDQLATVAGCKEFLVVVTDGISHDPDIDDPAVLAALKAAGHPVFAIGLGSFLDDDALIAATAATGGQYFRVTSADELPGVFATIFTIAGSGTSVAEDFGGDLGPFDSRVLEFEVGVGAQSARVTVSFGTDEDVGLVLVAPDGTTIDFDTPPAGVEVFGSAVQKTMRVEAPGVGIWRARIDESLGQSTSYDLLAFVESSVLNVTTGAAAEVVVYPDPMQVEVSVVARVPVGGAEVSAAVTRPDDSVVSLSLHDDGLAVHGDEKQDDGVYSALFTSYEGDGAYQFDFEVVNVDGGSASNQECGWYGWGRAAGGSREEGQVWDPIDPFSATAKRVLLLRGHAGGSQTGTADLAEHAELEVDDDVDVATSPPTAVAGFSLAVSADEPVRMESFAVDVQVVNQDVILLDGMALHLDADGDGELDVPSIPLGIGRLADGNHRLVFEQVDAPLALLAAGGTHSFLLTLGQAYAGEAVGGTVIDAPWRRWGTPRSRGVTIGAAALLAALLFLRRRSSRPLSRVPRPGAALVRLVAWSMLGAALLGSACRGSGGSSVDDRVRMGIGPGGFELTGGVSADPIVPGGDELEFVFRVR